MNRTRDRRPRPREVRAVLFGPTVRGNAHRPEHQLTFDFGARARSMSSDACCDVGLAASDATSSRTSSAPHSPPGGVSTFWISRLRETLAGSHARGGSGSSGRFSP
jgi:hypothetical protein